MKYFSLFLFSGFSLKLKYQNKVKFIRILQYKLSHNYSTLPYLRMTVYLGGKMVIWKMIVLIIINKRYKG